jgi:rod shape-determining protein MreC
LLIGWHSRAAQQGQVSTPERFVLAVLYYPQLLTARVGAWVSDEWHAVTSWRRMAQENQTLRQRVKALESDKRRLLRYLEENRNLRRLLSVKPNLPRRSVTAEVVSTDLTNWYRRVWLNRGSRDGVKVEDVVITSEGLVGQVLQVSEDTCAVLLLTDPDSRVGASVMRSGSVGIVEGTGKRVCAMTHVDWMADVREGDLVITSGQSTIFPKGLIIGRIAAVRKDTHLSMQTAEVEPLVSFEKLAHVFILTK